jgi:hypothetical protein
MAATIAFIMAPHSETPLVATANSSSGGLTSRVIVTELSDVQLPAAKLLLLPSLFFSRQTDRRIVALSY